MEKDFGYAYGVYLKTKPKDLKTKPDLFKVLLAVVGIYYDTMTGIEFFIPFMSLISVLEILVTKPDLYGVKDREHPV